MSMAEEFVKGNTLTTRLEEPIEEDAGDQQDELRLRPLKRGLGVCGNDALPWPFGVLVTIELVEAVVTVSQYVNIG